MKRMNVREEVRKIRFEQAHEGWESGRLTQAEAARLPGVCERTFRRYLVRFEAAGLEGLIDRRLEQASPKRAPVDEVFRLTESYRRRHEGWSARHFYAWYKKEGGSRGYTWVKSRLQEAGLIPFPRSCFKNRSMKAMTGTHREAAHDFPPDKGGSRGG